MNTDKSNPRNNSSDYGWLPGHWLSALDPPGEGAMFYQDRFGVQVAGDFNPLQPSDELPEYIADQLQNLLSQYLSGSRSLVGVVAEIGGNDFSMDIINEMLNPPKPILLPPGPVSPPSSGIGRASGSSGSSVSPAHPGSPLEELLAIIGSGRYIIDDWIRNFVCRVDRKAQANRPAYCMACEAACSSFCFGNRPEGIVDVTDCLEFCNMRKRRCLQTGVF